VKVPEQEALGVLAVLAGHARRFRHNVDSAASFAGLSQQVDGQLIFIERAIPPMSPALRCVVSLTTLFFCVYLAAVIARLARVIAANMMKDRSSRPTRCEAALAQATDALALAPMLSVLMIAGRLRAMHLELPDGDPPRWVQLCMYASTAGFFLRFLLNVACGGSKWTEGSLYQRLVQVSYCSASAVLYGGCAAIVCGILAMEASPPLQSLPLSPMMKSLTTMAVSYIVECMMLEIMKAAWCVPVGTQAQQKQRGEKWAWEVGEENPGPGGRGSGSTAETFDKLMEALAEKQQRDLKEQMDLDQVFLQFPLMLCVLLVGISLRAVQLGLEPQLWACVAMYITTAAIILQALWGVVSAASWMGLLPVSQSFLERVGLAPIAPASPDAGAGCAKISEPASTILKTCWVAIMTCLYVGTALILVSVFTIESKPMHSYWPQAEAEHSSFLQAILMVVAHKPISTAMRCTMLLTVFYFGVHMCLMVGRVTRGPVSKWANSVLGGIQRSLAFAPMLCVTMIACRMRAMQLQVRDPQQWAQTAMYVAALAVIIQVACSLCPMVGDSDSNRFDETDVAGKVAAIALLALRHVAAATLYVAVAVLVAALLFMEPAAEARA